MVVAVCGSSGHLALSRVRIFDLLVGDQRADDQMLPSSLIVVETGDAADVDDVGGLRRGAFSSAAADSARRKVFSRRLYARRET